MMTPRSKMKNYFDRKETQFLNTLRLVYQMINEGSRGRPRPIMALSLEDPFEGPSN